MRVVLIFCFKVLIPEIRAAGEFCSQRNSAPISGGVEYRWSSTRRQAVNKCRSWTCTYTFGILDAGLPPTNARTSWSMNPCKYISVMAACLKSYKRPVYSLSHPSWAATSACVFFIRQKVTGSVLRAYGKSLASLPF